MQVTSLYIDSYKLLKEFKVNFRKDVSILIGINGSGKSTILESIAQIFSDAFLKEYNKDKKYGIILSKAGDNLLYADKAYDITKDVIAGLNKAYKPSAESKVAASEKK